MDTSSHSRVFGLDALRATAILSVVLAHGGISFVLIALFNAAAPKLHAYDNWFFLLGHGGTLGVEMFFVLSGFLIGGILLRVGEKIAEPAGLMRFYLRRWFRTLPLFGLAVIANVLLETYFRHHHLTWEEIAGHALFLRNFAHISLTFFPESWSLAVEEWFYLLFPAALAIALRLTRRRYTAVFLGCAVAFFLFSLAARTWGAFQPGASWASNQRCTVIYRFDALMTGVMAAWIALKFPTVWRRSAGLCAVVGVLIFTLAYANFWKIQLPSPEVGDDTFFAQTYRFNLLSFGVALLLPALSTWTPDRERIWHTVVRKIALWSYALYLVHVPVIQLAGAGRLGAWEKTTLGLTVMFVVGVLVAIGVSAVLYRFYERPCMRIRDRLKIGTVRREPPVETVRVNAP